MSPPVVGKKLEELRRDLILRDIDYREALEHYSDLKQGFSFESIATQRLNPTFEKLRNVTARYKEAKRALDQAKQFLIGSLDNPDYPESQLAFAQSEPGPFRDQHPFILSELDGVDTGLCEFGRFVSRLALMETNEKIRERLIDDIERQLRESRGNVEKMAKAEAAIHGMIETVRHRLR